MASVTIPTRTDLEYYTEQVDLDGVMYQLTLSWSHRDASWYLSIADADGTPIASGLRVVVDSPLLQFIGHADRPLGELYAVDTSGSGTDPGIDELGGRVQLIYQEAA